MTLGCSSDLDYVEQTSWILFLKYLDDFEKDKKTVTTLFLPIPHSAARNEQRYSRTSLSKPAKPLFCSPQHFLEILKAGGRAGVIIQNTFLSNTDNASVSLRKLLLESCNLHTVLDLPSGTFAGAGVKTVVLFFEKGTPTRKVWFYQLNLDRNLGKTNPLNENDLAEFVKLQKQVRKKFITNEGKNQFRNGKRLAKNACSVPKKRFSILLFRFIKGKAISYHIFLSYKELFVKIYFFIID
jgi:type I restriction-modification system DNA methylase subunit